MSRIADRLSRPRPRTQAELRSILGQPIAAPCLICGSAIFAVQHVGGLLCIGCHWDEAHDKRQTAFWITAVRQPDGTVLAVHHGEDRGYRDEPAAPADSRHPVAVPGQPWDWDRLIPADRVHPIREPLAASAVACACGADTRHRSGVCCECRNRGTAAEAMEGK